jgi:predicted nucleotidyltransferase
MSAVRPDRIILFGSHASGKANPTSDLDILVIADSNAPRHKRSIPIYKTLSGLLVPKDIVVYTQQEIDEWRDVPQAFITTAIANGKVIYEKKQGGSRRALA